MIIREIPPAAWDDEADVLVVGFGGAGACAAIEAAENGARVVVLDRFHGGGATAASGAIIYAGGGTSYQKAAGFDDTPEEMYRYLQMEVGDAVSDATLRRFCKESRANLAWLESAGVPFEASLCPFKTSYPTNDYYLYYSGNEQVSAYRARAKPAPRGHRARGPGISGLTLFQNLEDRARDLDIQVRTQTQVQRLVLSRKGKVIGIEGRSIPSGSPWVAVHRRLSRINAKATSYAPPIGSLITVTLERIMDRHAQPYRAGANKGVVLAAGGFIFNRELVKKHAPDYLPCLPLGTPGDDGAGIKLGQSVGGSTAHLDRATAWSFYVPPDTLMHGVLVDKEGNRICSEDLYGATQGAHIAASGGQAYLIIDRKTYREGVRKLWDQAAFFQVLYMLPALLIGRKKARSLAALASKLGMPATGLQDTISAYNTAARQGRLDPLGKTPERFVPQEQPPFYAIDCSLDWRHGIPCSAMTLGGLLVNEETGQVLRPDGSAIAGLHAAGRNAVGICSQFYVSGLSIADAVFSGRRAGRHAALLGENEYDQEDSLSAGRLRYHGSPGIQGAVEAQGPSEHHHLGPSLPQEQSSLCNF
jgi:3-oxo-5alpha-steroid 4-dehydrogenase